MAIFLSCLLAVSPVPASPPVDGYLPVEVSFFKRRPIITLTLNGQKAHFLLDTGASVSILNSKDAHRLGFRLIESSGARPDLYGINGGTMPSFSTTKVKCFTGDMRLNYQWAASDLSGLVQRIRHRTRIRISGIIGSDLLKKYGFLIDYHEGKVWIKAPKQKQKKIPQQLVQH